MTIDQRSLENTLTSSKFKTTPTPKIKATGKIEYQKYKKYKTKI